MSEPVAPTAVSAIAAPPGLLGYIDAMAGDRIFGWAWDPRRPTARIAVRAEVRGETVAALIADQPRTDLAENRIGDGAHSFELTLPGGIDAGAISIVAICPENGAKVVLAMHPTPSPSGASVDPSPNEGIERLARAQRLLHRHLQGALEAIETLRASASTVQTAMASDAAGLANRVEVIEVAALRVDQLLQDHEATLKALARRGADGIPRVLAGSALLAATAALLVALLR
jgi:hypothetical protein